MPPHQAALQIGAVNPLMLASDFQADEADFTMTIVFELKAQSLADETYEWLLLVIGFMIHSASPNNKSDHG